MGLKRTRKIKKGSAARYQKARALRIAEKIQTGLYTLTEVLASEQTGIETHYRWMRQKPEYKKLIDEANFNQEREIVSAASKSLKKQIEGYEFEEVQEFYCPEQNLTEEDLLAGKVPRMVLTERRVKTKKVHPSTQATIFALSSKGNWRTTSRTELTGADGGSVSVESRTLSREALEEIEKEISSDE